MALASILSSTSGLLATSRGVNEILRPFVREDDDQVVSKVHSQVQNTSIILIKIRHLIKNEEQWHTISNGYACFIAADHLATVFTYGALIFEELESAAREFRYLMQHPFGRKQQLQNALLWANNKDILTSLLTRLDTFKVLVAIVVRMWMCDSAERFDEYHMEFLNTIDTILEANVSLPQRLKAWEALGDQQRNSADPLRWIYDAQVKTDSTPEFEFDPDLVATSVYRRARGGSMDGSFCSSRASGGWSKLSSRSNSNVSEISVVALPISEVQDLDLRYRWAPGGLSNDNVSETSVDTMSIDSENVIESQRPYERFSCEPANTRTSFDGEESLFGPCEQLKAQLLRFDGFPPLFNEATRNVDRKTPVSELQHVLRRGFPLLMLLSRWDSAFEYSITYGRLHRGEDSERLAKMAIELFLFNCTTLMKTSTPDLFTVEDLLGGSTLGFMRVVTVLSTLITECENSEKAFAKSANKYSYPDDGAASIREAGYATSVYTYSTEYSRETDTDLYDRDTYYNFSRGFG